jgi:hypothetical protein
MARYQKVHWAHEPPDEPVLLYSEITDEGVETRKVEQYRNGHLDYADSARSTGTTFLSEKTMPSLEDIARQGEFRPEAILKEEFEEVWRRATGES